MILEARAENCFSSTHVLKLNGQAIGKIEGRFFSEGLDLALTGRRRLKLDRAGWLTSHFQLKDADTDAVLVEARPAGVFTSAWGLTLTCGPAQLRKSGFFRSSYEILHEGKSLATVDRLGLCERGWRRRQNRRAVGSAGFDTHRIDLSCHRQASATARCGRRPRHLKLRRMPSAETRKSIWRRRIPCIVAKTCLQLPSLVVTNNRRVRYSRAVSESAWIAE